MKGARLGRLEDKLLIAIRDGDDATATSLERRILQKERKNSLVVKRH
jgi:hypothetical protein